MCPVCIANITVMAASATSGGGAAAFVFSKFYKSNNQIKTETTKMKRPVEKKKDEMKHSRIVSQKEWEAVRQQLVVKEKELTHVKNDCPEVIR